jgi:micrococcal nuclease
MKPARKRRKQKNFFPSLGRKSLAYLAALIFGVLYTFFTPQGEVDTRGVLQGTVTRVVDGDTIHVTVAGENRTVRLIGVDTPETVHPSKPVQFYGKEASEFTKKNLTNRAVWMEYDVEPKDKYNRHLAYVWLTKPGPGEDAIRRNMFNARLILEGYGKIMAIRPNLKYSNLFEKFQQEARTGKRGLWSR